MGRKKPRDRVAREELEQLSINFPALLVLLDKTDMDNKILPRKPIASALAETEAQALVFKGMQVVERKRRKA